MKMKVPTQGVRARRRQLARHLAQALDQHLAVLLALPGGRRGLGALPVDRSPRVGQRGLVRVGVRVRVAARARVRVRVRQIQISS